jgi:hypothetical protein
MRQLGIEMIAAYSPEARGLSEGMFDTHQGKLPQELAAANITTIKEANRYLREMYLQPLTQNLNNQRWKKALPLFHISAML